MENGKAGLLGEGFQKMKSLQVGELTDMESLSVEGFLREGNIEATEMRDHGDRQTMAS